MSKSLSGPCCSLLVLSFEEFCESIQKLAVSISKDSCKQSPGRTIDGDSSM